MSRDKINDDLLLHVKFPVFLSRYTNTLNNPLHNALLASKSQSFNLSRDARTKVRYAFPRFHFTFVCHGYKTAALSYYAEDYYKIKFQDHYKTITALLKNTFF